MRGAREGAGEPQALCLRRGCRKELETQTLFPEEPRGLSRGRGALIKTIRPPHHENVLGTLQGFAGPRPRPPVRPPPDISTPKCAQLRPPEDAFKRWPFDGDTSPLT